MEIGVEYPSPPTMMHTDPPAHTAYRKLVAPAFRPSRIAALEDTVRDRVRALLEPITAGEPIDFVPAVSVPFPLPHHRGLARPSRRRLGELLLLVEAMIPGLDLSSRSGRPSSRRCGPTSWPSSPSGIEPREDLISTLTEVKIADEQLSDDELHMFLNQLLVAGNETTRNLSSPTGCALSERPEQWARLVDDPALVPKAVEEAAAVDHTGDQLHAHGHRRHHAG